MRSSGITVNTHSEPTIDTGQPSDARPGRAPDIRAAPERRPRSHLRRRQHRSDGGSALGYCPGARYTGVLLAASSSSSGVSSTVVLTVTAPLALAASDTAAVLAW